MYNSGLLDDSRKETQISLLTFWFLGKQPFAPSSGFQKQIEKRPLVTQDQCICSRPEELIWLTGLYCRSCNKLVCAGRFHLPRPMFICLSGIKTPHHFIQGFVSLVACYFGIFILPSWQVVSDLTHVDLPNSCPHVKSQANHKVNRIFAFSGYLKPNQSTKLLSHCFWAQ